MKETRDMQFFQETHKTLGAKELELRDNTLDKILAGDYEGAQKNFKDMQVVGIGLQLCAQTIMKDAERQQHEEQQNAPPPPPAPVVPLKKKSLFGFAR